MPPRPIIFMTSYLPMCLILFSAIPNPGLRNCGVVAQRNALLEPLSPMCTFTHQLYEDSKQVRIDRARIHFALKDFKCSLRSNGSLIRPVGCSQAVKDVDDGDH